MPPYPRGGGIIISDVVSETVGLRTKPVSGQKKSVSYVVLQAVFLDLVLVLQVWCCVVKQF